MVSEAAVREALSHVNDPHVPVSLEKMAMLRGVDISPEGEVDVELAIPCLSCPGVSLLKDEITRAVMGVPGVRAVHINEGWHHEWTADMVDHETRIFMRRHGVQV